MLVASRKEKPTDLTERVLGRPGFVYVCRECLYPVTVC